MTSKMKIEIDIPELDGDVWESCRTSELLSSRIDDNTREVKVYITVRKKQSWKDKIVWPSVFREGHWLTRSDRDMVYCHVNKPDNVNGGWPGTKYTYISYSILDLSFLPSEFWTCKPEDSLVQVKNGGGQ